MKITYKFFVIGALASYPAASAWADNTRPAQGTPGTTGATGNTNINNNTNMNQVTTPDGTNPLDRLEKETATVTFANGSATLTDAELTKLKGLVPGYTRDKGIQKVIVAAWSDQAFPANTNEKLPESARDLAEKRADAIEDYLEKNGVSDVDTYSMAERPGWIAKVFQTDQAQIKGQARNKGMDNLNEDRISSILTSRGGPSKAVIIVKRDMTIRNM